MPVNRTPPHNSDVQKEVDGAYSLPINSSVVPREIDQENASDDVLGSPFVKPSGKLSSVTRKINEIKGLMVGSFQENKQTVIENFETFGIRSRSFLDACKHELDAKSATPEERELFQLYVNQHYHEIVEFGKEVKLWLEANEKAPSIVSKQSNSKASNKSSSSSLRNKAIEMKARATAKSVYLEAKRELEIKKMEEQQKKLEQQHKMEEAKMTADLEAFKRDQVLEEQLQQLNGKMETFEANIIIQELNKSEDDGASLGLDRDIEGLKSKNVNMPCDNNDLFKTVFFDSNDKFVDNNYKLPLVNLPDLSNYKTKCNDYVTQSNANCNEPKVEDSVKINCPQPNINYNGTSANTNDLIRMVVQSQIQSTLPKVEPIVYDGTDPTIFRSFMISFDYAIASKCFNDFDKYSLLLKYTSGYPHELVRNANKLDPTMSYQQAVSRLEEKYGNEFQTSAAYMKKLMDWKNIGNNDTKGLEDLSLFLEGCLNIMPNIAPLTQLNSPDKIMLVVRKLPGWIQNRWVSSADEQYASKGTVDFKFLVGFVSKTTRAVTLPIFSEIRGRYEERKYEDKKYDNGYKRKSFHSKTETSGEKTNNYNKGSKSCLVCSKDNHILDDCFFFKKKDEDERFNYVKEHRLCFGCLGSNHSSKFCRKRIKCKECQRFHPTSLHRTTKGNTGKTALNLENKSKEDENNLEGSSSEIGKSEIKDSKNYASHSLKVNSSSGTGVARKIACAAVPIKLKIPGTNKYIETYMGMDGFSTDCYIDKELTSVLKLDWKSVNIELSTIDRKCNICMDMAENLEVLSLDGKVRYVIPEIFSKANWPFTINDSPNLEDVAKYSYLKDVPFQFIQKKIGILVGMNLPDLIQPLNVVSCRGQNGMPYASEHYFGWAINGPLGLTERRTSSCFRINCERKDNFEDITQKLEDLYSHDFEDKFGEERGPSFDDLLWEKKVQATMRQRADGYYEVGLPFRDSNVVFPSNYAQVYQRLMGLKKRLQRDSRFFNEYNDFMQTMLKHSFAELVPPEEGVISEGKSWYLAHHGVVHKQKGKLRVVFDCSARFRGTSLNDKLLKGPDLANSLIGVLLRFRQEKVACMGDIEKMFYMIKTPKEDSNFMRFLWFKDGDLESKPIEYRLVVHVFGAVSSPSVANYVLKNLINLDNVPELTKKNIMKGFYVDDLMISAKYEDEAIDQITSIGVTTMRAGFRLTGFVSNSRKVLRVLPEADLAKGLKDLDISCEALPYERALGVVWNVDSDSFGFKLKLQNQPMTKRGILSSVFSLYDPFGIVGPVTIEARRIFQTSCSLKIGWDDKLPSDLEQEWKTWLRDIHHLDSYSIPRCYKACLENIRRVEVHIFCDGSMKSYGAAVYLRFIDASGDVECSLVMAKVRLTPLNNKTLKTVPRIELNAARLGINLKQIIQRELEYKVSRYVYWSDSTTVLKYIKSDCGRFQRFVSNRIAFIRSYSEPDEWRHVPTQMNPADLLSRGCTAKRLGEDLKWKTGPEFLQCLEVAWPPDLDDVALDLSDPEIKKVSKVMKVSLPYDPIAKLLNASSNWYKTKQNVGWILRLKSICLGKRNFNKKLSLDELKLAEKVILKIIQKQEFSNEIEIIANNFSSSVSGLKRKKGHGLSKLMPFIDPKDGLMRVGGRLRNSSLPYETRHQIILSNRSHVATLIVRNVHEILGHLGRESVLAFVRKNYWIVGGNNLVRKVLNNCVSCRKRHEKTSDQVMSDLPTDRVDGDLPPFSKVGIDCFGPFLVSRGRGRAMEKRYGVIFTCLLSRAVHLEITYSLETDSFINSLRRFIARRGTVTVIRSDNGTNFVGASKELKTAIQQWNQSRVEEWLKQRNVEWKFQPPSASHFGGVFEREIKTIKKVLNGLMDHQNIRLDDELLNTLFCEVEAIINNRPLTSVSSDPLDLNPLTPNQILLLNWEIAYPPGLFSKDDLYHRRKWKQVQYLAELFWSRWKLEYLPLLQERTKWTKVKRSHQVGDLVLVVDNLLPRGQWCMGKITQVYEGSRGQVRVAKIKICKRKLGKPNDFSTMEIERPIVKLILLRPVNDL